MQSKFAGIPLNNTSKSSLMNLIGTIITKYINLKPNTNSKSNPKHQNLSFPDTLTLFKQIELDKIPKAKKTHPKHT
jgi:hypothetical protein